MRAFETVFRMNELGRSFSGYERNRVFLNTGSARFADVSASSGLDFLDDGRGLARVDWDLDGDLDLWLANRTAPQLRLMRNELANDNHFLPWGDPLKVDAFNLRFRWVGREESDDLNDGESDS